MHNPKDQYDNEAMSLAAPAPGNADDQEPAATAEDGDLDDLCERWVTWCSTRRFYAPAPNYVNILGQMSGSTKPVRPNGPDAANSPEIMALHRTAANLLDTYVGRSAGEKILAGRIQLGDTETIQAVILFSDLRDFTRLAGQSAPGDLIRTLNELFECQVPAIEAREPRAVKTSSPFES